MSTIAFIACLACAAQAPAPKKMNVTAEQRSAPVLSIQRQISLLAPTDVTFTVQPLVSEPFSARSRAPQPSPSAGVLRFLGSAAQNSRLCNPLKDGNWAVAWSFDVNPEVPPAAILEFHDHVLVQSGDWTLLKGDGSKIATGQMGRGALTADGSADAFYLVNQVNHVEARSLADGALQFRWPLAFGEAFTFPIMARTGKRILLSGVEKRMFGHPPTEPTMGVVYVFEVSGNETDPTKLLHSVSRSDTLIIKDPRMLSAIAGDHVLAATPGYLLSIDSNLQVQGVYGSGDFEPLFLSADEAGWMHLIVRKGVARSLWVVSPEGKRVVDVPIDSRIGDIAGPPAIGYDRKIYLWTKTAVVAFGPDGKQLWDRSVAGGVVGVGITTDDKVLVGAGSDVTVLDAGGEQKTLHRFEKESISTPPILASNGDLLVATRNRVYRLSPKD